MKVLETEMFQEFFTLLKEAGGPVITMYIGLFLLMMGITSIFGAFHFVFNLVFKNTSGNTVNAGHSIDRKPEYYEKDMG